MFFWSVFSRIRTEYGEILRITWKCPNMEFFLARIFPHTERYSVSRERVQIRRFLLCISSYLVECGKIRTRKNSTFGHFSRSDLLYALVFNCTACKHIFTLLLLLCNRWRKHFNVFTVFLNFDCQLTTLRTGTSLDLDWFREYYSTLFIMLHHMCCKLLTFWKTNHVWYDLSLNFLGVILLLAGFQPLVLNKK